MKIHTIIFFLMTLLVSCQNKSKNTMEKYEWEESTSAPLGYPIEVYRGGFSTKEGAFVSLYGGTTTGTNGWGYPSGGMSNNKKTIPDHLHVIWLSYAEDAMFEIDTDIDREKITDYFNKGYEWKTLNNSGEIRHKNYSSIVVGFAPGGVVVIWVSGSGIQKEIGRYQGKKIEIPQAEIDALDYPDKTLFEAEYRRKKFAQDNMVPLEIQVANKNKPIPFGLWDTYRKKYQWKPTFKLQDGAILDDKTTTGINYLNGEVEKFFHENFPLKTYSNNAIPKSVSFSWKDRDEIKYGAGANLNEESALAAFKEVYSDHPETVHADLEIKINIPNTFFTVTLRGNNGKEVFIKTENVEVFKR